MLQKLSFILIGIIVLTGALFIFNPKENTSKIENPTGKEENNLNQTNALIDKIFSLAEEGKVPNTSFVAGETNIEVVTDKWGDAIQSETTKDRHYIEYPKHNINMGYHDGIVFDIRLHTSKLKKIHFNDLKKQKGNPDETRYYKDDSHDQIILVYQVNSNYQLKWIMPKPTDDKPNPKVHHISIFTEPDLNHKKALIKDMSLNEKIGQMIVAGISGTTLTKNTKKLVNHYKIGGIILYRENMQTPDQTVKLTNKIRAENSDNHLPILLGVDQEGGEISKLPGDLNEIPGNGKIGDRNNQEYSYKIGAHLGKMVKSFGFNLNFAPVLDVNSNPDNPVIGERSFGEDPKVVSNLGIQTMKGIQSQGTISVIKHFPGHGDTSVDSHLQLPTVNKTLMELENLELIPFKKAINNGADVVMVAHILLPQIDSEYPSSMSQQIISGLLRQQLNFSGVIVTDDMTMRAITNNYDIGNAAVQSVKSGSDMIMVAHDFNKVMTVINALKEAVEQGEITEERINKSVTRIMELKEKYRLNDERTDPVNVNKLNKSLSNIRK
ncbi:beta-N-acetylhexosaminidase [Virgibacillus litoralis]|uniref:beta-N-acetylhexosaminidase n=1 Tax=Virgibacillus litoralis TaxID=578221 RepID=A0ABS4HCJ2_9BACI|nr:beta-N-acetylhexosaminidase [Virgibacillus litoralis]MBP1948583.1 beta-N-acetylhexosaminidase [Virgibacillus litoralis]